MAHGACLEPQATIDRKPHRSRLQDADTVAERGGVEQRELRDGSPNAATPRPGQRADRIEARHARMQECRGGRYWLPVEKAEMVDPMRVWWQACARRNQLEDRDGFGAEAKAIRRRFRKLLDRRLVPHLVEGDGWELRKRRERGDIQRHAGRLAPCRQTVGLQARA